MGVRRCGLLRLVHCVAQIAQRVPTQLVAHHGEELRLLLLDVVTNVLDQDGDLRVEALGFCGHLLELGEDPLHNVMLLETLESDILGLRDRRTGYRVEEHLFDRGMHRELFDDSIDDCSLFDIRSIAGLLELFEESFDGLVVVFEQADRIHSKLITQLSPKYSDNWIWSDNKASSRLDPPNGHPLCDGAEVNSADDTVRIAGLSDAAQIGRLLHDFNTEYHDVTPGPTALAKRIGELLSCGETMILLAGEPCRGLAVLRFRPSIWTAGLECYLAELYVVPERRGHGIGRRIMLAAIDAARDAGADYMDLGTSEDDRAARRLYESLGFTNREPTPGSPVSYYYELEL